MFAGYFSVRSHDQLLPQPFGVRAGEFARQRIEAAHALDRDQESFIRCQAGVGERPQLVAQMALQFLHVGTVKGLPAAQVRSPLRDLLLERLIGESRHTVHACHPDAPQGSVHGLPLLPLGGELRPAFFGDPVVLAPAAVLGRRPLRDDMSLALESVQHRIEHAVGPLQVPA